MRKIYKLGIIFLIGEVFIQIVFSKSFKERFNGKNSLVYKIYFNGIYVGILEWRYLGKTVFNNSQVEVLYINSNTQILKILDLESKEKIFLDSNSYLPLKVERDIIFFGKKELIEEIYEQKKGYIKIINTNHYIKDRTIYQNPPIQHIFSLLCFFPKELELKIGNEFNFNLPTYKLKVKVISEKEIETKFGKKSTYYLIGEGKKKFNLWLDKEDKLPLFLEFILPLGKVRIVREL